MRGRLSTRASILAAAGLFALSCGESPTTAGGSGTGTDNTVWTAARVVSLDSAFDSSVAGSPAPLPLLLRLDSTNFDFSRARADGADLAVFLPDSTPLPFVLRDWSRAARRASLWVRIDGFVRGSGQALVLRWGRPLPASSWTSQQVWSGITDSVRLSQATVPVADFDSGTGMLSLPCRCNAFWAGASDSAILVSPPEATTIDPGIEPAGAERAGQALHVVYAATQPEYVLIGARLGRGHHRFAGLDSVTFWMRGSGLLRLALENGDDPSGLSKAWTTIRPDTSWQRISIRPSDFDEPGEWTRGWSAVRDSINTITFFATDGGDLWIDDVRFHGLSPSEIP